MTANDYSFEPVGSAEPSVPVATAIPSTTPTQQEMYRDEEESPSDAAIMVGCGLVGWVVAGPFLAILTCLGGKYAADKNQGPIGDASRAVGRIASAAGKKAKEEHLLEKLKDGIRSAFTKKDSHCKKCNSQGATSK